MKKLLFLVMIIIFAGSCKKTLLPGTYYPSESFEKVQFWCDDWRKDTNVREWTMVYTPSVSGTTELHFEHNGIADNKKHTFNTTIMMEAGRTDSLKVNLGELTLLLENNKHVGGFGMSWR